MQGMTSTKDDVTLSQLVAPSLSVDFLHAPATDNFLALRIKGITLLSMIVALCAAPPEEGTNGPSSVTNPGTRPHIIGSKFSGDSHPKAFARLKLALDRFCEYLPPFYQFPWRKWDEGEIEPISLAFSLRKDKAVLVSRRRQDSEHIVELIEMIVVYYCQCVHSIMEREVLGGRKQGIGLGC